MRITQESELHSEGKILIEVTLPSLDIKSGIFLGKRKVTSHDLRYLRTCNNFIREWAEIAAVLRKKYSDTPGSTNHVMIVCVPCK